MITGYTPLQLTKIMEGLYPAGQWSVRDSEIVGMPPGKKMPTLAALAAEHTRQVEKQSASEINESERATKKTALFTDLKTRLAADLGIQVETPADLAGKIEGIIPAARLKRNAKATMAERITEMEKQVEILTMFVALLSRQ